MIMFDAKRKLKQFADGHPVSSVGEETVSPLNEETNGHVNSRIFQYFLDANTAKNNSDIPHKLVFNLELAKENIPPEP